MDTSEPQTLGRMARPSVFPEAHDNPFFTVAEGMHAGSVRITSPTGLASDGVDELPHDIGQEIV